MAAPAFSIKNFRDGSFGLKAGGFVLSMTEHGLVLQKAEEAPPIEDGAEATIPELGSTEAPVADAGAPEAEPAELPPVEAPPAEGDAAAAADASGDASSGEAPSEEGLAKAALEQLAQVTQLLARHHEMNLRAQEAAKSAVEKMGLRDGETYRDAVMLCERAIHDVAVSLAGAGPEGYWHVKDVLSDSIILGIWKGSGNYFCMSVPYVRGDDGAFSFGQPKEVVARTVYEAPMEASKMEKAAEAPPIAVAVVDGSLTAGAEAAVAGLLAVDAVGKALQGVLASAAAVPVSVEKGATALDPAILLDKLRASVHVNGRQEIDVTTSAPAAVVWPADLNQEPGTARHHGHRSS